MKSYESKAKLDIPADEVLNLISTAAYVEEEACVIGAVKATAVEKSRDEKSVSMKVDREDPTREPGAKPGKTEKNVVTVDWDLEKMRDKWNVKVSGKEKLVKVFGTTWIEPDGDGCIIKEKGSVDIKIPIVGNLVAKGLVKDLAKNVDKKAKLIRKKLRP